MKLELHFQDFKKAVLLTEKIAGRHMALPVLSCLLFDVKKGSLKIKATNLDIGIEAVIPAKSDTEEIFAVPASVLSSFLSQINDYGGVIKLESVLGNIQVNTLKSRGVIKTVPHEDFPSIPTVSAEQKIQLQPEVIVKGLKSVWYSSSVSSVKPELSSVYIYTQNNHLVFVATDSFRLAERKVVLPSKIVMSDVLIPFKNTAEIIRVLESTNETMTVSMNKNLISFEVPNKIRVVSRVIDGVFPDYKQIIPKNYTTEIIVLKQDLMNALKISNVFSDRFNQVHITVDPKAKIFEVQTKNSDIGENKTTIDATIAGERVEINFNYKYIIDCFQSIDSDSISLQLSSTNRPMIIKPVSGDQSFMYLVMPMNR
jgi:DNA polymerase-3 subunit beta